MKKDISFLKQNLIAHRGAYDNIKIPENSILSSKEAIKYNYPIELDVRLTKDNKVIVFHDKSLLRMCNVDKLVNDLTYNELKKYKLLNTNNYIPLFEEVLKLINGQVPIIVELKVDKKDFILERKVIKLLSKYSGLYAIQSFDKLSILYFRIRYPDIIRGILINKSKYLWLYNLITKPDFISYSTKKVSNKKVIKYRNRCLLLGWKIKNQEEYDKNRILCDNSICDNIKNIKV